MQTTRGCVLLKVFFKLAFDNWKRNTHTDDNDREMDTETGQEHLQKVESVRPTVMLTPGGWRSIH